MRLRFEILGNATLLILDGDKPLLVTDAWLVGARYFGRWALDHLLTYSIIPALRRIAERAGVKAPLKYLYRPMLGDPTPRNHN
jgi:hypothetical protein